MLHQSNIGFKNCHIILKKLHTVKNAYFITPHTPGAAWHVKVWQTFIHFVKTMQFDMITIESEALTL